MTVRYYVVDLQGGRYGPADFRTLNEWAAQGRIISSTILVEEVSGRQIPAHQIPGLQLLDVGGATGGAFSPGGSSRVGGPFGQTNFNQVVDGSYEANISLWLSAGSLVSCLCIPGIGIIVAAAAVFYAVAATRKGGSKGSTAMVVAVIASGLQILMIILGISLWRA